MEVAGNPIRMGNWQEGFSLYHRTNTHLWHYYVMGHDNKIEATTFGAALAITRSYYELLSLEKKLLQWKYPEAAVYIKSQKTCPKYLSSKSTLKAG